MCVCVTLQRWAHLTRPVWGAHHLEYMATPLVSGGDDGRVIISETIM